ncbi:hypothetical protein MS14393_A00138 (plasmid) [Klebsiella pneumoniae]|nr:hypothetical protein MS14393_A00138 [Klebsiella pneumoniae]
MVRQKCSGIRRSYLVLLVLNLYDMIFFPDCMRCSAPLQIRLCLRV